MSKVWLPVKSYCHPMPYTVLLC